MNAGKLVAGMALVWFAILRWYRGLICKLYNWEYESVDLTNGTIAIKLSFLIKNPFLVGLTLRGIIGDVYVQGEKAGYINTRLDYYLGGGKTHIVPIIVNLSIGGMGAALVANIQSGDVRTLTIDFDGKLLGKWDIAIPLKISMNYDDLTKEE